MTRRLDRRRRRSRCERFAHSSRHILFRPDPQIPERCSRDRKFRVGISGARRVISTAASPRDPYRVSNRHPPPYNRKRGNERAEDANRRSLVRGNFAQVGTRLYINRRRYSVSFPVTPLLIRFLLSRTDVPCLRPFRNGTVVFSIPMQRPNSSETNFVSTRTWAHVHTWIHTKRGA